MIKFSFVCACVSFLALGATSPTLIEGADAVAVSYPSFFEDLERLRA